MAGDDFEYNEEHEDEPAHTALLTSAADADSSSDDDGDGWMDQLGDATVFLADDELLPLLHSVESDSDFDSDDYASANVMFDDNELAPAYSPRAGMPSSTWATLPLRMTRSLIHAATADSGPSAV